ncbi:MAG: hypothetical protein HN965_02245 [Anaerolineae bacterium]|jgi:hypothetical protein|nr:hypothetical protein [Anaerolineae bacterium]MBT7015086.1 hypothetical protein [Anaerolineae bacterium]
MTKGKKLFYFTYIGLLFILFLALRRLYSYLTVNLDNKLTVAVSAGIAILVLSLFFFGMILSWVLIWIAKRNQKLFNTLSRIFPWLFSLVREEQRKELEETVIANAAERSEPVDEEVLAAIRKPKRRGRPRRYPDEVIRRVVLAWENRGPNYPLTLPQFLEEHFGSTSTGMPDVPSTTFYDWRDEVLAEAGLKDLANTKKQKKKPGA